MGRATAVLLVILIVLFAIFGWKAFGILATALVGAVFVLFVAAAVAVWLIRRRMNRAMRDLRAVFVQHEMAHEQESRKRDAIDVEADAVRKD